MSVAGMSVERLERIGPVMQASVDAGEHPCVETMVLRRGQVVHHEARGWRDREKQIPAGQDSLFRIASMTKPITSVAALMLYEKGRFQLEDPVSRFIPAMKDMQVRVREDGDSLITVPARREISIRDTFLHTTGFGYSFDSASALDRRYQGVFNFRPEATLASLIDSLTQVPLYDHPGQTWRYSFSNDVLARIVEIVSGMPFAEFLRLQIFEPLRMADTAFGVPPEKRHRLATVYTRNSDLQLQPRADQTFPSPEQAHGFGGHGLVSTPRDYARFAQCLLNGGQLDGVRLIGRKTIELMTRNHLAPDQTQTFNVMDASRGYYTKGYGYGLAVRVMLDPAQNEIAGSAGSYGWAGAFNTYFWIDPHEELIGLVFSQVDGCYVFPLERSLMTLAYQAICD